jgi:hypothetical protein
MLLIGSRHRRDSCSEAFRFARSSSSRPIRRSTSTFRTPLLGFIDRPSVDTTVTAATPRLGRRPDFGSGLPRPEHVPLLPFLPASAVSAAASRSEDPLVRRSAGLLHPAADHGVRQVSDSLARPRSRAADPKVVDPKVRGSRPLWRRPFEAFPSSAASTMPSPRHVLSDAVAFTGWACPLAVRVALACVSPRRAAPLSTSGLCSTEESVAFVRRCRRTTARCSLGLWIDPFPDAAARRAAQLALDVSPGGPNRFGVPAPERGGRQGVSALSGSMRPMVGSPRREDRVDRGGSGDSRRSNLGRTPPWP